MTMDWPSADWVAAIAAVLSVLVAIVWGVVTLRNSLSQLTTNFEERRYSDLDRLHFELLRMRSEIPILHRQGSLKGWEALQLKRLDESMDAWFRASAADGHRLLAKPA